ncbi:hypothetical protein [Streptomyces abyssomicinicus]|nr:hypothetical protein [Streptomyces abyssomicinicus]
MVQQHQSGEHIVADLVGPSLIRATVAHRLLEHHQNVPAPSTSRGQ